MIFVCLFYLLNNFKILHRITRERERRNSKQRQRRSAAAKRNFEYVPFTVFRTSEQKNNKKRNKKLHNKRSKRVNWRRQVVMECNGISQNTLTILFARRTKTEQNAFFFSAITRCPSSQCFIQNRTAFIAAHWQILAKLLFTERIRRTKWIYRDYDWWSHHDWSQHEKKQQKRTQKKLWILSRCWTRVVI